jgi:type IV pilus assembly protein PilC
MKFEYKGKIKDGRTQSGFIDASSKEDAVEMLQKNNIYIISLRERKDVFYQKNIRLFDKVKSKDIVLFSRQLAILFKAGIPIVESLRSIAKQTKKRSLKEQTLIISDKVESGTALSLALSSYPKTFSTFYIGMVRSGEASGRLSEVFEYLADHTEKEHNFNSKIIGSLIYPAFILAVFFAILILLIVFVVPGLSDIFRGMDVPLSTKIILGMGDFLVNYWWIPVTSIILLIVSFIKFKKTDSGRKILDKIYLRIPIIGTFIKKMNLVRVSENLSTLISGGLPIVQALEVTAGVLNSETYKKVILKARDNVRKGDQMSSVFIRYPKYFPVLFIQMVIVGEKTGNIDTSLVNVVNFYKKELDNALETMIKLIEPVMIIFIGGLVGLMVVSMLTPIYQMTV